MRGFNRSGRYCQHYKSKPSVNSLDCTYCLYWDDEGDNCTRNVCYSVQKKEKQTKCSDCRYRINGGGYCVSASCFVDLDDWLQRTRSARNPNISKQNDTSA